MKSFWKPVPEPQQNIDDVMQQAREGKVSRRRLITSLTALGVSASAAGTIGAAAEWLRSRDRSAPAQGGQEQRNIQQHDHHITTQLHAANSTPNAAPTPEALSHPALQARVDALLQDYHPEAIVEDMLSALPIVGHDAIRLHKAQEFLSFSKLNFRMISRYAVKDQVVAEWVASGVLDGEFKGLIGNGDAFEIPGVTVVSRDAAGKIVKESIYYNLAHVQRHLRFKTVAE
ncbi:MAG TPA: ester cyclase [Chloroflexota bacterium]